MKGDDFCTTVYRSVDAVILAHIIKSFLLAIGKSKSNGMGDKLAQRSRRVGERLAAAGAHRLVGARRPGEVPRGE